MVYYSKYFKAISFFLLLIIFSSCSDQYVKGTYVVSKNEYLLNAQTSSLQNIPAEGGVLDVRINASNAVNWEIQNLPVWLSSTQLRGTGSQDIIFEAQPNESLTSSRTQIFNIATTNSDWSINLPVSATQQKKSAWLSLSPADNASWTFDSEGGRKELSISSNADWVAECEDSFVSLSKNSGTGDGNMLITVAPYNYIDMITNRVSYIYFKAASTNDVLQVLTITQTPLQNSIESETINIDFDNKAGSRTYTYGTVQEDYSVKSDAGWLTISKNKENAVDVTISVAANENDDDRTSNAYVYLGSTNSIKYLFTVSQKGNMLTINPETILVDANGGNYNIEVSSETSWTARNENDWITVQKNVNSCSVSISENNSLDTRSGSIAFNRLDSNGDIIGRTVLLTVNQAGRTISPDSEILQFGAESSSQNLNIESDASWTLTSNENWINLSHAEGFGDGTVVVTVDDNTTSSSRVGTLMLNCLGKTIEISVVQESAFVNSSSTAIAMAAVGDKASVSLSSNVSWSASSSEKWLSVSPTSGSGESTLELIAEPNSDAFQRTAVVTITAKLGDIEMGDIKINVSQNAPSINVSQNSLQFGYTGGSSSPIVVTADGDYTISASASWIKYSETGNTFVVTVGESKTIRGGTLTLTLKQAPVSTRINVLQSGTPVPSVSLESVIKGEEEYEFIMSGSVNANGKTIEEVGFIYTTSSDPSAIENPRIWENGQTGTRVRSTLNGSQFKASTKIYKGDYIRVRAYVFDDYDIYYSEDKIIKK